MERKKYTGDSRTTQYRRKKELAGIKRPSHTVNCPCELHEQARNLQDNDRVTCPSGREELGLAKDHLPQMHLVEYCQPSDRNELHCEDTAKDHEGNYPSTSFQSTQQCDPESNVGESSCAKESFDSRTIHYLSVDDHQNKDVIGKEVLMVADETCFERTDFKSTVVSEDSHCVTHTSITERKSTPEMTEEIHSVVQGIGENSSDTDRLSSSDREERTSLSLHGGDTDSDDSIFLSNDDDSTSLCDVETFQAYYLEENPNLALGWDDYQPAYPDDPDNPDDPDDPDPGDNDDEDEHENSDGEDHEHELQEDGVLPDFGNEELRVPLIMQNQLNKGDFLLIILATALRHNKTFLSILDEFENLNVLYGHRFFPGSLDKLYSIIQLDRIGMKSHVYCGKEECGEYIGRKDRLEDVAVCRACNTTTPIQKASFFVDLNFRYQLKRFLNIPGIWNHLQYRTNRMKAGSPAAIEDIFDGAYYKRLRMPGGPLESPFSFSYVFSTDGCRPSKKGKLKVWPIFVRLNELPPQMRQKFHFLVALYVGKWDPNFQCFLKPFVAQANILSTEGIMWKPDGVNEVTSTIIPLCHCVDAPARSGILQMTTHSGNYGCTYCTHEGQYRDGAVRFPPFLPNGEVAFEDRTHAGMIRDMLQAHNLHNNHMGHRGLTQLMLLDHFDLREGQAADDLHPDHEGCAKHITELLLAGAPRINRDLYQVDIIQLINRRLSSIKTPSRISRKPSKINCSLNGSEWRNWLLFFGPPCLNGIIDPEYVKVLSQLSHACYLLSQDVIEPHELNEADRLLQTFAVNVYEKFGLSKMKFNVHVTSAHKVRSIQQLGPPWSYSTYNFESLHSKLLKKITSPKGSIVQVVTRYLLQQTVNCAMYSEEVPQVVRERLQTISSKRRLQRVRQVGNHMYVVGKTIIRQPSPVETEVLAREGHNVLQLEECKSMLLNGTRYWSAHHRHEDIKSYDSFLYTHQDTFCTIQQIISFRNDTGEEQFGLLVVEHDVARHFDVACHIAILRNKEANLLHYIRADVIKCPAIKMEFDGVVYAVSLPNCYDID